MSNIISAQELAHILGVSKSTFQFDKVKGLIPQGTGRRNNRWTIEEAKQIEACYKKPYLRGAAKKLSPKNSTKERGGNQ